MLKAFLTTLVGGLVASALLVSGCNAGTSAELLSYDNIEAATVEVQKGVSAYDSSVRESQARTTAQLASAIAESVVIATKQATTMPVAEQEVLRARVTSAVTTKLADLMEQEKRRGELYAAVMDNLLYIQQLCAQSKQFVIYRADVGTQWKTYLEATARANLKTVKGQ